MATNIPSTRVSSYLSYLPAIFQEGADQQEGLFIGRFLLAFEKVLTGLGDADNPGLEELLDGIPDPNDSRKPLLAGVQRYFNPGPYPAEREREQTPKEFLDWLAGWVALALRADMDELRQRDLIARSATLYQLRGTKRGLEKMIAIYTRLPPSIDELTIAFQIGVHSRIGEDTRLDGGPPHFFKVLLQLPQSNAQERLRQELVARAIIDMEKPAHTYYHLDVVTPAFQIGVHSTIGVDTLLSPPVKPLANQESEYD